jgi:hypothetical protein
MTPEAMTVELGFDGDCGSRELLEERLFARAPYLVQLRRNQQTLERGEFDAPHRSNVEASSEEVGVATARFVKTGITPDEYDQMREKLGVGDTPPAGGVFHAAAVGEDGKIRVFEVWDSREQAEAWGEKVMAVRTEAGFGDGPPSIEYLDVHRVVQR